MYNFRFAILQHIALTASYLFIMKTGIDIMTPTVIIGAVADERNTGYNPLSDISEEQSSWIGEQTNSLLREVKKKKKLVLRENFAMTRSVKFVYPNSYTRTRDFT